jgi:hypothetical protein
VEYLSESDGNSFAHDALSGCLLYVPPAGTKPGASTVVANLTQVLLRTVVYGLAYYCNEHSALL